MTSQVALVTGAARGIGAATVRALLDGGYAVTAVDACSGTTTPAGVNYPLATDADLATVVAPHPDRVLGVTADVREPDALESAVAATLERFGRLDCVVAAAGVLVGGDLQWDEPVRHLRTALDVNLLGAWNTAAATVPALLRCDAPTGARFVALTSAAGGHGLHRLSAYSVSKHAVVGLVRSLAADLVGTSVTAVGVSPGSTDTPMLAATARLYDTTPDELARHQGIRRALTPEEIAATVVHCCSPAGAGLNGSIVHVEGGFGT